MRKPRSLGEELVEDFFSGKSVPGEDELTAFAQSVRALATGPIPAPTEELAWILVGGLTIDNGDLLVSVAGNTTGPHGEVPVLPKWRRPLVATTSAFAALFTKVGAASAVAKTGLVAAVAAGAMTVAGAAGALPGPVQNALSHAVDHVLPVHLPTDGASSRPAAHPSKATSPKSISGAHLGSSTKASTDPGSQSSGPPANPGSQSSTGLNTANSTPAAGHAPTSVPTPTNPGSQSSGR